jgi:tRNA 2-thiouridine synthesizing protein E
LQRLGIVQKNSQSGRDFAFNLIRAEEQIKNYPDAKNICLKRRFAMPIVEHAGVSFEVDDDGFLVNMDDWNEQVACGLAEREGGEKIPKDKMEILYFMRDYYKKFNSFPILNYVCKNIDQPRGCIREKFLDPMKAWKIAGLPKPGVIQTEAADEEHKIYTWLVPT